MLVLCLFHFFSRLDAFFRSMYYCILYCFQQFVSWFKLPRRMKAKAPWKSLSTVIQFLLVIKRNYTGLGKSWWTNVLPPWTKLMFGTPVTMDGLVPSHFQMMEERRILILFTSGYSVDRFRMTQTAYLRTIPRRGLLRWMETKTCLQTLHVVTVQHVNFCCDQVCEYYAEFC